MPRTREPGFEPEIIKNRTVVEEGLESQIISMYAKGMSVRDISEHVQSLYGIELSAGSISNITDKVIHPCGLMFPEDSLPVRRQNACPGCSRPGLNF